MSTIANGLTRMGLARHVLRNTNWIEIANVRTSYRHRSVAASSPATSPRDDGAFRSAKRTAVLPSSLDFEPGIDPMPSESPSHFWAICTLA